MHQDEEEPLSCPGALAADGAGPAPLALLAEENEPDTLLEGLVTEVLEQGFVMEDIELGSVLLNVDETTVMDGILAEGDIEVGQYVFVEYDGRLTRSFPRRRMPTAWAATGRDPARWTFPCPWACCSPATRPSAM